MRIRIIRTATGEVDGVNLRSLQLGLSYDVSPVLGAHLVGLRFADLMGTDDPMLLLPLSEQRAVLTVPRPRVLADDRGYRGGESLLAYESGDTD